MIEIQHRRIDEATGRETTVAVYDSDAATVLEALREAHDLLGAEAPDYLVARPVGQRR